MTVRTAVILAGLIIGATLTGGGAATVTAAQTDIQIRSVGLPADNPAPGERFTIPVNLANLRSSSGTVAVTDVYVRGGGEEYGRIEDVGTLAPGGNLTVPLTLRIDEAGGQRLTVHALVEDATGDRRTVKYPVYVEVRTPDEAIVSLADAELVAGQAGEVNLTVSNGDTTPISNVRLTLDGDLTVARAERVRASLAGGTQTVQSFDVTVPEPGERALDTTLTYTTRAGNTRTVERTVTLDVDPAVNDPTLEVRSATQNGSSVVRVELQQFGTAELRGVQIRARQDGETVARTRAPDVPAEGTQAVTLDSTDISGGRVTVVATYTVAGESQTLREPMQFSSDVVLDASNQIQNGTSVIRAELQQFGTVTLRDVEIRAESDGETVARVPVRDVVSEGTRTVRLDDDAIPAGPVTVVASYTAGSERQTTTATVQYAKYALAPTAAITLTGVEVSRQGDVLTLDGDAANVGTSQVNSVIVSVVATGDVRPTEPNREYFIDDIGASQFASFEATAVVPSDVERLPIRVQYTVDGQRVSSVLSVDLDTARTRSSDRGGGGSPVVIVGLLALVAIGGLVVYRWRR